jgi:hypothetical protein
MMSEEHDSPMPIAALETMDLGLNRNRLSTEGTAAVHGI